MNKTWIDLLICFFLASSGTCFANDIPLPTAEEVIALVNARDAGDQVTLSLRLTLTDKDGKQLVRETFGYRKNYGQEKRSVVYYTSPAYLRDTGLLTYDYPEANRDDDQWAYLPDMRKVRRIPAASRGALVLGTDFTFEDIKNEGRIPTNDYTHKTIGAEDVDGHYCYILEATPIDEKTAFELGYGKVQMWLDAEIWYPRKAKFWDVPGDLLKTIHSEDVRKADGIWTTFNLSAKNHQNGHTSEVSVIEIDYVTPIDDDVFTERALRRGVRSH